MIRKMFSCLLACALLLSLLAFNAGAVSNPNTSKETARTLIPENVATIIATYFLRDAQTIPDNAWSDNTSISNTVTMYDTTGDVSAYSFELETAGTDAGYIVVSAYPDTPNTILEFSETAEPVYKQLTSSKNDTIVYTGGLNYFKSVTSDSLLSVDGIIIDKQKVSTPLTDSRSVLSTDKRGTISDPFTWAENVYGGTYTAKEWKNAFENYCQFRTTREFNTVNGVSYSGHCGPTAITNLLEIVARYRNYNGVPYNDIASVFSKIAEYGKSKNYFENGIGTYFDDSASYIKESFSLFSIQTSTRTYDSNEITYNNIKSEINGYNPLLIGLYKDDTYKDHFVAGYAYTLLTGENKELAFVKIADGHSSKGRYLPIDRTLVGFYTMDAVSILSLG